MTTEKRVYFMDNVRTLIILSLFLVHACEMYHIGDGFFIEGPEEYIPTLVYSFFETFIMSILFFFAGFSTVYSIQKRGVAGFYLNRCKKLLLPLFAGLVTILPLANWFILKNHTDFSGTLWDAYLYYFTHVTNFIGYDGSFAPWHLWFLLYLFAITIIAFPIIVLYTRFKDRFSRFAFGTKWVAALIILILVVNYGPSDESPLRFILYYVLGIVLAENQLFSEYLDRQGKKLFILGLVLNFTAIFLILRIKQGDIFTLAYLWRRILWTSASVLMTLGVIAMGKKYLNEKQPALVYLSERSFLIYYFHLPVEIAAGYFILRLPIHYSLQILLIIASSCICTWVLVWIYTSILSLIRWIKK